MALEAQAQSKLEWPKCDSHRLSLAQDGLIECKSSFRRLRKFLPLESDTWKVILHSEIIESHSDFLQKSYKDLHRKDRTEDMDLVS